MNLKVHGIRHLDKVCPADAGVDPGWSDGWKADWGMPRQRGDEPSVELCVRDLTKYAPLTRGWAGIVGNRGMNDAMFPASAGMNPRRLADNIAGDCAPRRKRG